MRVLGIDYGERRIGIALSDPTGVFAQPLTVVERRRGEDAAGAIARIVELVRGHDAEEIVVGMPLDMSGKVGEKAREVRRFAERLRSAAGVPVREWDERLSTVAAERALLEGGLRRSRRKKVIDKTAAALILGGYLDHARRRRAPSEEADR